MNERYCQGNMDEKKCPYCQTILNCGEDANNVQWFCPQCGHRE